MKRPLLAACLTLAVLMATTVTGWSADKVLNLYIWSEYIPEQVLAEFTKETGITVNISTYDSNEAMYAKVKLVGKGYDLVVPSSDYVGLMRRQGLLTQIDTNKLSNFKQIDARFTNQIFDPSNAYSVPYMWGSTGLAVNTGLLGATTVEKIADLYKPELKGKLLLPNDPREVLGLGLKKLGYSINERNPEHIHQAYEQVRPLMAMVRTFDSDSPKQALLSGEVAVGLVWNGEAYVANNENKAIHYIYPPEGFSLWLDSLCVPRGAEHLEAAYTFINYVLRPEVSARISQNMGYSSPNPQAVALLPEAMRANPIVNPPAQTTARGEFLDSLDDTTMKLYEQYWIKLKSK